jgi:hypothetical protein
MDARRCILQSARLCIGMSMLVLSVTTVWGAEPGSAGSTQRFRGTVVPAPELTAQDPAAIGMTLRFPRTGQVPLGPEERTVSRGTTLRFLPLVDVARAAPEPSPAETTGEAEGKRTFN